MEENKKKKESIGVLSIDTKVLYDKLVQVKVNDIISYEELSAILGRDVRDNRNVLYKAIRRAEEDDKIVFETIIKKGYKRIDNSQKVKSMEKYNRSIRRTTNRAGRRAATIDFDKLNREEKNKFNTEVSVMAAIKHFTKNKTQKKIGNRIEEKQGQLSLNEVLKSSINNDIKKEFEKEKRID